MTATTDPFEELSGYTDRDRTNIEWVAVPVRLLRQIVERRECGSLFVIRHDEDGPCAPQVLRCRRQQGHTHNHHNGYCGWTDSHALADSAILGFYRPPVAEGSR